MSASAVDERQWERAFQLSYFILLDRSRARECVARAIEKLAAQRTREKRRSYWRARKRELTIRRISRPVEDTLQWLIFLEAESFEKEQESQGAPAEADMVVRYIKHLAQLTTVNSSFHVNIGFNRLLRKYTTTEVQEIYELATQRYPGSEEYRKAKGKLLSQLAARFERFLRIYTAQYGELQFETHAAQQPWVRLVEECLEFFSPWSGHRSCLQDAVALSSGATPAAHHGRDSGSMPDRLETSRCHWFMHSTCYGRLAQQSGFDPPQERLSVPRFLHHDGDSRGSNPGSSDRRTAPLSAQERQSLHKRVTAVVDARGALALEPLKVVAQGIVCARLDPALNERRTFEVPEGTRLLELRSNSDQIVATHWIDYGEDNAVVPGEYTIAVRGGRQLAFTVLSGVATKAGQGSGVPVITIESGAASTSTGWLHSLGLIFGDGRTVLRPVLASLAIFAVGVLAGSAYFTFKDSQNRLIAGRMAAELAAQKANIARLERMPRPSIPLVARYAFRSNSLSLRGAANPAEAVVTFGPGDSTAILELPVTAGEGGSYRARLSSFPQEQDRLSEMALRPVRRADHWVVEFALPAALVEGDTHYLLTLTQTGGADSGRYLFKVQKR